MSFLSPPSRRVVAAGTGLLAASALALAGAACELVDERPVLFPEPDPGPYSFEDLVIPVAQLDAGRPDVSVLSQLGSVLQR